MSISSALSTVRDIFNELFEPNDFKISTWMAIGAVLLLACQSYLPPSLGSLPPLLYIIYRIVKMVVDTLRLHSGSYTTLFCGWWTATLPEPKAPMDMKNRSDGLVMFVLGARINQSVSRFVP